MAIEPPTDSKAAIIEVSVDGKPACIGYDHEFLFVNKGHSKHAEGHSSKAYVRVPLALVLNASFVSDSDGGSLLVRFLSPPVQTHGWLLFPLQEREGSSNMHRVAVSARVRGTVSASAR